MRILLAILVLIAVAIYVPSVRSRIAPKVQTVVLDPLYEWNTKNRVKSIRRLIEEERTTGGKTPAPAALGAFIRRHQPGEDSANDPWGNPYYLQPVDRRNVQVVSAGRDGQVNTVDDIRSEPIER